MIVMQKLRNGIVHDTQLRLLSCLQAQATSDVIVVTSDGDADANGATAVPCIMTANGTVLRHAPQ